MGIKKSGLVSNNYRNYFNILKQKDGEIYLFEMLTVRLNFHSSACVRACACVCVCLHDRLRKKSLSARCVFYWP